VQQHLFSDDVFTEGGAAFSCCRGDFLFHISGPIWMSSRRANYFCFRPRPL